MPDFKIYSTYTNQTTGCAVEGGGWWSTETGFGYGEMPVKKTKKIMWGKLFFTKNVPVPAWLLWLTITIMAIGLYREVVASFQ